MPGSDKLRERGYCDDLGGVRAARFDNGKPELDQVSPEIILGIAEVGAFGRKKYRSWNWMKGFPLLQPFASCMRHLLAWRMGEDIDKESGIHHLKHAAWNLMAMLYFIEHHPELDNRPVRGVGSERKEVFKEGGEA